MRRHCSTQDAARMQSSQQAGCSYRGTSLSPSAVILARKYFCRAGRWHCNSLNASTHSSCVQAAGFIPPVPSARHCSLPWRCQHRRQAPLHAVAVDSSSSTNDGPSSKGYSLQQTTALVETAMLAAVSGLVYLVATILKVENSVGYFLPLPVVLATMRSGIGAGWKTMMATSFLLVVLLGPLKAVSYVLLHGLVAATLGTLWKLRLGWWTSVAISSVVRMAGQLAYLLLSSVTMNENFFWVVLNNVYSMLDNICAAVGAAGAPSTTAVACLLFSLLLVNSVIYCFLLHVVFRLILQAMGFKLGPLPGIVKKYLYAGMSPEMQQQMEAESKA